MSKYIIRRLLQIIPTMLGVFTVIFILAYLMPGDPVRAVMGPEFRKLEPEVIEEIRDQLGLNKPFLQQYAEFLVQMLRLDFGRSFVQQEDVIDIIGYRFPNTLQLMSGGLIISLLIGIPAGIIAAQKQYSWVDNALIVFALLGISVPVFWLALLAQLLLTQDPPIGIAIFPVAGKGDASDLFDSFYHMILPSLVLGMYLSATLARVTRSAMLEVRSQDYIRTAYAKGLRSRRVLFIHQLRNALIPVITVIALDIGALLGGSIVTETVFNWPGLGRATISAIERRDTPVILGILLLGAFLFVIINLLTDLVYALIDPRIRYS